MEQITGLAKFNSPEIADWCLNVEDEAGDFLRCFAQAVRRADVENFIILMPAIVALYAKYPEYARPYGSPRRRSHRQEPDPH